MLPPVSIRLLLNVYTSHVCRVSWNGDWLVPFSVLNEVKQEGVISPVLFCIYLNKLLGKLAEAGVGCYIGNIFVGALAYADDIVLLPPTAKAMRLMLSICDHYAIEYSILFNSKKSKCISFDPRYGHSSPKKNLPAFFIGRHVVDYVDSWPHLAHIISNTGDDRLDIINRCNSFCAQINNVLCCFKSTSIILK